MSFDWGTWKQMQEIDSDISFKELLTKFYDVSEKQYYHLNHAKDLQELEETVRKYKIFNMND